MLVSTSGQAPQSPAAATVRTIPTRPSISVPRPAAVPQNQPPSDERNVSCTWSTIRHPPLAAVLSRTWEIHQQIVSRRVGRARQPDSVAQQEGVTDDLGLLLDPVTRQWPARLEAVAVAAQRVAMEQQVPFAE